jgi:hypothetical protein
MPISYSFSTKIIGVKKEVKVGRIRNKRKKREIRDWFWLKSWFK